MGGALSTPDSTEILIHDIRDEVGRLAHHPIGEVKRLEHVVADGESGTALLLLALAVAGAAALAVVVIGGISMAVYYLT